MEKTRKIQSIIQDVIEGRKDNNEATIDILALCVVSQQRELLDFMEVLEKLPRVNVPFDMKMLAIHTYLKSNCG